MKLDDVIELYIKLRDKKAELKRACDEQTKDLDEKMAKIEIGLLKKFQSLGTDSVKTGSGTAYTSRKTSATLGDAKAFFDYVKDNNEWGLADIRVNKKSVETYKDEHGDLPVGVNWREEIVVNVRRS